MDVKTLSTIIGHVSSSTTLNVYAHVTDEMRVYAHSEEECEKLLADIIAEMRAEIAAEREQLKAEPKAG